MSKGGCFSVTGETFEGQQAGEEGCARGPDSGSPTPHSAVSVTPANWGGKGKPEEHWPSRAVNLKNPKSNKKMIFKKKWWRAMDGDNQCC